MCDLIRCHLRFLDGSSKQVISWNVRILMSPWATSSVLTQRVGKSSPLLAETLHQCDISGWLIPRPLWRRNPPNLPPPTPKILICVPSDGWRAPLRWIQIKNRRWGSQKEERERTFGEKIKSGTAWDDVPVHVRASYTAGGPLQAFSPLGVFTFSCSSISSAAVELRDLWEEEAEALMSCFSPRRPPCDTGGRRHDRSPRVFQTVLLMRAGPVWPASFHPKIPQLPIRLSRLPPAVRPLWPLLSAPWSSPAAHCNFDTCRWKK